MNASQQMLRFAPSRVEGTQRVEAVSIHSDRLELLVADRSVVFHYLDMARWGWPAWFWRLLARCGCVTHMPSVADRNWFHPPTGRFFAFYTKPPAVVYMPDEPVDLDYGKSTFHRVQEVIGAGGYSTFDLG